MKAVWLVGILFLTQAVSFAGDTAYDALRLIGKDNRDLLNHVVEAKGSNGQPQPVVWTIVIDDQTARGGVREFEVSKGRIVSEHAPVHAYAGANLTMDFKHLNLDSEGAFTIANQEAAKRNVGFDFIDYSLRGNPQTGAPEWTLRLMDNSHALLGTITIAADNGAVLNTTGFKPQAAPPTASNQQPQPATTNSGSLPPVQNDGGNDNGEQPRYGIGHQINKGLHRIGGALQQFFTGQRTVDKRFENEP